MATVYIGGASIDENGNAHGGKAGNQSGKELRKQAWYKHSKGWRVFRCKDREKACRIADDMRFAIANKNIGYDQYQRNTLYTQAEKYGFNCSKVETPCECDCSSLVRVCCAYVGISLPASFRTVNEPSNLLKTGEFEEMKGAKYTDKSAYLREGDILCTASSGHTVIVLNNGSKAEDTPTPDYEQTTVSLSVLKRGCIGNEVVSMQTLLKGRGYSLGSYGIDGDFGSATEKAVKKFQTDHAQTATGVVDAETWTKLIKG